MLFLLTTARTIRLRLSARLLQLPKSQVLWLLRNLQERTILSTPRHDVYYGEKGKRKEGGGWWEIVAEGKGLHPGLWLPMVFGRQSLPQSQALPKWSPTHYFAAPQAFRQQSRARSELLLLDSRQQQYAVYREAQDCFVGSPLKGWGIAGRLTPLSRFLESTATANKWVKKCPKHAGAAALA